MQVKKCMYGLALLGAFSGRLDAHVTEYKKLYRGATHTTVDLLYDSHTSWHPSLATSESALSAEQFFRLDRKAALEQLHPTEQKVLNTLTTWEQGRYPCDLIWEWSPYVDRVVPPYYRCSFLHLCSFFNLTKMKHVNFIPSDFYRARIFVNLVNGLARRSDYRITNDLRPLSFKTGRKIARRSGRTTWHNYKNFRKAAVDRFKERFKSCYLSKNGESVLETLYSDKIYDVLCPLELLSHVLKSKSQRIVVYAGAGHCSEVADFLEKNGFAVLDHERSSSGEALAPQTLNALEKSSF